MMHKLKPGLYEDLLTSALAKAKELREEAGWTVDVTKADITLLPEFLARHVYELARRALEGVKGNDDVRTQGQVALANRLIEVLYEYGAAEGDSVEDVAQLIYEVSNPGGLSKTHSSTPRPTLSLRRTGLLVNGRRDVQIASEIAREIRSADRIDLLCAFVRHSGLRLFKSELEERVANGTKLRVIASVYTGSTERRALDELEKLGAKVKVSYDIKRTRLHAKAWLFHRNSGLHTAYVGSSNLTHSAQVDGLEWNVRVSAVENPEVVDRFVATFEQYWQEPEFEDYSSERDVERLDKALKGGRDGQGPGPMPPVFFDLAPKPHQAVVLEALEAERQRGHSRNLVVAATGTGKTFIAAFDYKQLRHQGLGNSLLFVAHREEILRQSQQVFQLVLRDPEFGELLVGGQVPSSGRHVFASVQSLANRIEDMDPEGFDVVIVDEFHHAAAKSYDRLLSRLNPGFLLGLTATPERADGKSVLCWFDGRITSESRLWDALDQGLLCPFHYFGANDSADLSTVEFRRGRYLPGSLDNVYTGDDIRANRIHDAVRNYVTDPGKMRALGFCAGVKHAHFMAQKFNSFGYPAVALDAKTPALERRAAVTKLRKGEIRVIFSVDLFNEGVDLPELDTLLLLRPTESATVFLQQLGRGLRWADGKRVLTVLDFVGQVRREFRYDIRFRALIGGTRRQVERAVEADFPQLPPGCAIKLDRIAKETVLKNVKGVVHNFRRRLVDDLIELGPETRLPDFLRKTGTDLDEIYRPGSGHCFTELRQSAGFGRRANDPVPGDPILKAIGRLIHVDDHERIETWREFLDAGNSTESPEIPGRLHRLGHMLFAILGNRQQSIYEIGKVLDRVRKSSELRHEILDLLDLLADRIRTVSLHLYPNGEVPLASHSTYTLGEIMAAYNRTDKENRLLSPQGGVLWDDTSQTDLLFVTLEKSDRDYSPSTKYADYPVSPTLFHWESQNSAAPSTQTGRRYVEQAASKTKVILFVRERKRDDRRATMPYHCLGFVNYRGHESERPMKIHWELERPMPGWLYQAGKVVAG